MKMKTFPLHTLCTQIPLPQRTSPPRNPSTIWRPRTLSICLPGRPACQKFHPNTDTPEDIAIQQQRLNQADSNCRQAMPSTTGRWMETMRPTMKRRYPRDRRCTWLRLSGCTLPPSIARRCLRWGPMRLHCTCSHAPSCCLTASSRERGNWSTLLPPMVMMRTSPPRTPRSPTLRRSPCACRRGMRCTSQLQQK